MSFNQNFICILPTCFRIRNYLIKCNLNDNSYLEFNSICRINKQGVSSDYFLIVYFSVDCFLQNVGLMSIK